MQLHSKFYSNNKATSLIMDADKMTICIPTCDQISAYRSKRNWEKILSYDFLLENPEDFQIKVELREKTDSWYVTCEFVSSCGRYVFWRLLNGQAAEAKQKLCEAPNRLILHKEKQNINLGPLPQKHKPSFTKRLSSLLGIFSTKLPEVTEPVTSLDFKLEKKKHS